MWGTGIKTDHLSHAKAIPIFDVPLNHSGTTSFS
jgi:hypothetical protein